MVPKCSFYAVQTSLPLMEAHLREKLGIPRLNQHMSHPCQSYLPKLLAKSSAKLMYNNMKTLCDRMVTIYMILDKGSDGNDSTLPKLLCWYNESKDEVMTQLIDVDTSKDCSSHVAKSVKNSFKKTLKIIPGNPNLIIHGCTTGSGGGGTLKLLERELRWELASFPNVTVPRNYVVASCSLHNIQTCFCNVILIVFGLGGLKKGTKDTYGNINVMQLLHGVYNIQNWIPNQLLKKHGRNVWRE